jgi:hypothetical protein
MCSNIDNQSISPPWVRASLHVQARNQERDTFRSKVDQQGRYLGSTAPGWLGLAASSRAMHSALLVNRSQNNDASGSQATRNNLRDTADVQHRPSWIRHALSKAATKHPHLTTHTHTHTHISRQNNILPCYIYRNTHCASEQANWERGVFLSLHFYQSSRCLWATVLFNNVLYLYSDRMVLGDAMQSRDTRIHSLRIYYLLEPFSLLLTTDRVCVCVCVCIYVCMCDRERGKGREEESHDVGKQSQQLQTKDSTSTSPWTPSSSIEPQQCSTLISPVHCKAQPSRQEDTGCLVF